MFFQEENGNDQYHYLSCVPKSDGAGIPEEVCGLLFRKEKVRGGNTHCAFFGDT